MAKLFVGNLSYQTDSARLGEMFATAGSVVSAEVVMDRMSGRSRGFGFVEMATDEDAQNAINMFNGKDTDGRAIVVNIARPKEDRPRDDSRGGFRRDNRR